MVHPLILAAVPCAVFQQPPAGPDEAVRQAMAAATTRYVLREGSFLTRVQATVHQDQQSGWWYLRATGDEPARRHVLIILPSRKLQEMQQVVEAAGDEQVIFELSGEVFLFGGQNFVLPTHAPRLIGYQQQQQQQQQQRATGAAAPQGAAPPPQEGESIDQIIRRLTEAVGPLRRSSALARGDGGGAEVDVDPLAAERDAQPLVARRGHLMREERGAWTFLLDADAGSGAAGSAASDGSLVVMPCLLLERMAAHALQLGRPAPMLLSGRVYHYQGRRYLLPTLFQVPHERTPLQP